MWSFLFVPLVLFGFTIGSLVAASYTHGRLQNGLLAFACVMGVGFAVVLVSGSG